MEEYIGYSIKEKISDLLCIILIPVVVFVGFVERACPVALSILFLCAIPYTIIEKRYIWYKYKIDNKSLSVKKLFGTQIYLFNDLKKVLVSGNASKPVFLFKFQKQTIKVFYGKNIAPLVKYFLNLNIDVNFKKQFLEFENSKRLIHISDNLEMPQKNKGKVFFIFLISSLFFIDFYVERSTDFFAKSVFFFYFFLACAGLTAFSSLAAFIMSFKKIKHSDLEYEYIDKNGFHLLNLYIPFSEITEIVRLQKKFGVINLIVKTKDDKEHEISTIGFNGDILYEMYLAKKIPF